MNRLERKKKTRKQRKLHIRKKVAGTDLKPRVTLYKSNCHLIAQVIDDTKNETLAAISTHEKEFASLGKGTKAASELGTKLAERLKAKSLLTIVFDRNGYKYHGVVKAFADGIRSGEINF